MPFEGDKNEEHFRFSRVPFGLEATPFLLGATLDQQSPELEKTVTALRENTFVDNIMQTGGDIKELKEFKKESESILEGAKLLIHKWESNIEELEVKICQIQVPAVSESESHETKHFKSAWQSLQPVRDISHDVQRKTYLQRGL